MQNEPLAAYCINARKQEDDHMTRQIITDNVSAVEEYFNSEGTKRDDSCRDSLSPELPPHQLRQILRRAVHAKERTVNQKMLEPGIGRNVSGVVHMVGAACLVDLMNHSEWTEL